MRFRLFLLTTVTLFLVTVLTVPWFISLSKLELDDTRAVLSIFPTESGGYDTSISAQLQQRTDIQELIPSENVSVRAVNGSFALQAQPFRPRVVSVSTATKNIMDSEAAIMLPRVADGQSFAHLTGRVLELEVSADSADESVSPVRLPVKVAGVFDQGWSTLRPNTALVSGNLLDSVRDGQDDGYWYLTLAPDADTAGVISDLNALGYDAFEEQEPLRFALMHRSLPWLALAVAFVYAIVLAQQTKRVASSGVLTMLSSRARFVSNCLLQSVLGSLLGVGLGLGLGWLISRLTFLKELTIDPSVWVQSSLLIGMVLVGTLVVVAVMSASLWRAAQQSNSLEHFKELFT